jgi:hypothetical protein
MRKLLILALTLASFGVFDFGTTEAKANAVANAPQVLIQEVDRGRHRGWYRRNNRRNFRAVTRTRIVRYGYRTYRETYLVRFFDNGRTSTTLISRERIA